MIIKQTSVFVENRPGRLAEITAMISACGVNISALSVADTTHFGIMRCIVDDPGKVEDRLRDAGVTVNTTEVIALRIPDEPGGLAGALKVLADADIAVEYAYAFIAKTDNDAYVVLRTESQTQERAAWILSEKGYTGLKQ